MREVYEVPEAEFVELFCEDIILASNPGGPGHVEDGGEEE